MSRYRPWMPVTVRSDNDQPKNNLEIRKTDCVALQAVWGGVATPEQQKAAMVAIMHMAGVNDLAWLPEEHGGDRDSAFAAGKQHVGHQLRKLLTFPLSILTGEHDDGRTESQSDARRSGKPADARNADRAKR